MPTNETHVTAPSPQFREATISEGTSYNSTWSNPLPRGETIVVGTAALIIITVAAFCRRMHTEKPRMRSQLNPIFEPITKLDPLLAKTNRLGVDDLLEVFTPDSCLSLQDRRIKTLQSMYEWQALVNQNKMGIRVACVLHDNKEYGGASPDKPWTVDSISINILYTDSITFKNYFAQYSALFDSPPRLNYTTLGTRPVVARTSPRTPHCAV